MSDAVENTDRHSPAMDWEAVEQEQKRAADIYTKATGRVYAPLLVSDWRFRWEQDCRLGRTRSDAFSELVRIYDDVMQERQADGIARGITELRAGSLTWAMVQVLFEDCWPESER